MNSTKLRELAKCENSTSCFPFRIIIFPVDGNFKNAQEQLYYCIWNGINNQRNYVFVLEFNILSDMPQFGREFHTFFQLTPLAAIDIFKTQQRDWI